LYVHAPILRIEVECLKCPLLAQKLNGIDVLIATIVPRAWVPLRVLVRHGRAEGIEDCSGRYILRGDEEDGLALALDFSSLQQRVRKASNISSVAIVP